LSTAGSDTDYLYLLSGSVTALKNSDKNELFIILRLALTLFLLSLEDPLAVAPRGKDRLPAGLLHVDAVALTAGAERLLHGEGLALHTDSVTLVELGRDII